MSLMLALNTALSSLNVNQRSLAVLSQNIANANNKEYSRKVLTQEAVYLDGTGAGVRIRDVSRKVDEYLQKSVRTQGAVYGRTTVLNDYSDRLQAILGKPGSQNNISAYVNNFFNAIQSLAQTPENASLKTSVTSAAATITREFNNLSASVEDMRYQADRDISANLELINANLREIYVLNGTISNNTMIGKPSSELEDKRDTMIDQISEFMDIQTYRQNNGAINLYTGSGFSMLDENLYQLSYIPAPSADFFANNNATAPVLLNRVNSSGAVIGSPQTLVSAGAGSQVTSQIASGKLKGLLDMRDRQLPDVAAKLDMLASRVRDEVNEIHNSGSSYPGTNSYTGTRLVNAADYSDWSGKVRLALLDANGKPVPANYSDEDSGMRPLTIDLSTLNNGNGAGKPTVQGIIDEINRSYGVPQNKVKLGNLNDIKLVLNNTSIPGTNNSLDFDFQLDNISGEDAKFWFTGVEVLDENGTDITNLVGDAPEVSLASTNTYTTTDGSSTVTVKMAATHTYKNGDVVYLETPTSDVNGIDNEALGGFFTISNVTATGFDITASSNATSTGTASESGLTLRPPYAVAPTGEITRTASGAILSNSITGNPTSTYYMVKANVAVADADGNVSTSTITYRVDNLQTNASNMRIQPVSANNTAQVIAPTTSQPSLRASLVDANGVELAIINNKYSTTSDGYLKITAGNSSYTVAIDSLDSSENGKPEDIPAVAGSGRGFSYFFELNNLFTSNRTTGATDNVAGSAKNMSVNQTILNSPNLVSLGNLTLSRQSANPDDPPVYTYERDIGDNSVIAQLAQFNGTAISFDAAGDLSHTNLTMGAYAGQLISTTSAKATANRTDNENAKLLLDGFNERSDSMRGVNLDEELANTIIYQNSYSASARIITVANQLFESLLGITQ